jgi:hypothetical protein
MSDCADCILRFVKRALMKYTLRIPFLILRITENRISRDLVICCLLKPRNKTRHFTAIYWQTRGEVLKSTHIPDGHSLHWLSVCINQSLVTFLGKFLGEFGPNLKLNFVLLFSFFLLQHPPPPRPTTQTTEIGLPFILAWINPDLLKTCSASH